MKKKTVDNWNLNTVSCELNKEGEVEAVFCQLSMGRKKRAKRCVGLLLDVQRNGSRALKKKCNAIDHIKSKIHVDAISRKRSNDSSVSDATSINVKLAGQSTMPEAAHVIKLGCGPSSSRSDSPLSNKQATQKRGDDAPNMASGFLQAPGQPSLPSINSPQRLGNDSTKGTVESWRNKVVLAPGCSLMDWIRYGHREPDLAGTGGKLLTVTEEELTKHNTEKDAWIVLRGKVYNITPYMDFHPGGIPEMMRGAGIDGTQLFDEIHKWVNAESMLSKCFVGNLQTAPPAQKRGSASSRKSVNSLTVNGPPALPNLNGLKPPSGPMPPKYDWYQSKLEVTIVVYTKWADMICENVLIDKPNTAREILITILLQEHSYFMHIELEECITDEYKVQLLTKKEAGKVEITLHKILEKQWTSLGRLLERHGIFNRTKDTALTFRKCTIDSISALTHDSKLFCVRLPAGSRICLPIGYHVHIKHDIEGMEVCRSYTAVSRAMYLNHLDKPMWNGQVLYLMIKIYADGALTPWMGSLTPGDSISVSSPVGTFDESCLLTCTHLVLLAAGTGFTPMVRLLQASLQDAHRAPICRSVKLMCFNKTQADILWKEQLDTLIEDSFCLEVEHVLSGNDDSWTGKRGRIRAELLHDWLPARNDDVTSLVCICGPIAFTKEAIRLVEEQGFTAETVHAFQA